MREPITDPEILDDLRHRAASERDPTRTREAGNPFAKPVYAEHWLCRGGCGTHVGVTADDIARWKWLNATLRARKEPLVPKDKVMFCPSCKKRDDDLARLQGEPQLRREPEQLGLGIDQPREERSSGMQQKRPTKRRSL